MKEENKYYTPQIEEFCVGFEYEFKVYRTNVWREFKFLINDEFTCLYDFEEDLYRCRVKYLSAEDIVDLGFVKTKEYSDEIVFQKNISDYEFIELTFHLDDDYNITAEKWNQSKMAAKKLPINEVNWQSYIIFRGVIKNKHELQTILKQIRVL